MVFAFLMKETRGQNSNAGAEVLDANVKVMGLLVGGRGVHVAR